MVNSHKRSKASKGAVSVELDRDRLRLRWRAPDAQGNPKRYSMAFGVANAMTRAAASQLARTIELDLLTGHFDPTLRRYKRDLIHGDGSVLLVSIYMDQYIKQIEPLKSSSIERYKMLKNHLLNQFGNCSVDEIGIEQAQEFVTLRSHLKRQTVNHYVACLGAVWNWGMKQSLVTLNPWAGLASAVEPSMPSDPFTLEEIGRILEAFQSSHYRDFVAFLLGSGCRIGEAIALHWDAVNEDCSEVWIGRSWDAKARRIKATKTNQARTIPVPPGVQAMLQGRDRSGSFVFPSPKGGMIDRQNFRSQHWKPALDRLGIPYRTAYNARHTRWSHEIAGGMDVAIAARYAGNSPRTMMERYYGATQRPRLKDWE